MRGDDRRSGSLFSYVDIEKRVRADHPLRTIKTLVDEALDGMNREFAALYSGIGRPSVPPEQLLRAMLLQAFYSIRSERQLMERIEFDLLYRWFVGLGVDDPAWDATTFTKNRDRLLEGAIAHRFLAAVLAIPRVKRLLSSDHFSVDGTLIEAWASMKSFKTKGEAVDDPPADPPSSSRNAEVDFRGETRSNDTHASTTDPDARLYRKGRGHEAKLSYLGHVLMENRNGLVVGACVTPADGHGERHAALVMIERHADQARKITLGADKAYDTQDFVNETRAMNVTPHVAQNDKRRRSAIDGRVTRHAGYAVSQTIRKRIEEVFGWGKEVGRMRRTLFRGLPRVGLSFAFTAAAYNLVRLPKLLPRMTKAQTIVGKWRLTAMSTWDRDYIDLVEPGYIAFAVRDRGEMAFGVVTATLDCAFDKTRCDVSFDFTGCDEGDEVSGQGWAEMTTSDTISGEIEFRNGDDTTFEARRW